MDISLFDYPLPKELIAQKPADRRDESRLLVVDRFKQGLKDDIFRNIAGYFMPGDLLVLNDTRVIPARLYGTKQPGGAAIEMLLLEQNAVDEWTVIAYRASRLKKSSVVRFDDGFHCEVVEPLDEGKFRVRFAWQGDWHETLKRYGHIPLPPYIERTNGEMNGIDRERYQTVYAKTHDHLNSAAAPTAGLHFTPELLSRLGEIGVNTAYVTLRVGLDTFMPLRVERVEEHKMHSESYFLPEKTAQEVVSAKERGNRVIAVGTTSVRVLESAFQPDGTLRAGECSTNLYIYPGFQFNVVDAMVTNFHLPHSTLLMLVSAFMGNGLRVKAYTHAVENRFRFFSYGDAMLIQ